MPKHATTVAAVHALRRDPDHVGMGAVARHLERQLATARPASPIPAWALPGAINPLEPTIDADQENSK